MATPKRVAATSSTASVQHQLISTLKWLLLAIFLVTGSITWKLVTTNNYAQQEFLDLPREQCGTANSTGSIRTTIFSGSSISQAAKTDCQREYERVTNNRTQGLTEIDLEQSRALVGNRHRLALLAEKLQTKETPVNAVFCGGSITLGHGVKDARTLRFSHRFEAWMNDHYQVLNGARHQAHNYGSHGADICAMAKRINIMIQNLPPNPDLFVLEFAVNDYQGQDHKIHLDHKTEIFFEGFEKLVVCAEIVVFRLLSQFPDAAVLFLEFQTAITNRKTAAALHMAVAKHYEVPVISYAETFYPDFYRLMHALKPYNYSTATIKENAINLSNTADPVLPYPHGCSPCLDGYIVDGFRDKGCKSLCVLVKRSGHFSLDCEHLPNGREPCYLSFLAHDAVHPSAVGHQMAAELIAEAIAKTGREICEGRKYPKQLIPTLGLMVADPVTLSKQNDFVYVKDTMEMFGHLDRLTATNHTKGFSLYGDVIDRPGYIATNESGNESVEFLIELPPKKCYSIWLSVLKSYENMGTFTVVVKDLNTGVETTTKGDALWKPRISIPSDIPVTRDDVSGCTGRCTVSVTTNPQIEGRGGNKVKIMTLSARECVV